MECLFILLAVIFGFAIAARADPAVGARLVKDIKTATSPYYAFASPIAVLDGKLLFASFDDSHPSGIWISDGTQAGTSFIADPCPIYGYYWPTTAVPLGDRVIFSAYCPSSGQELWVTDGTASGTALLKDLFPGPEGSNSLWRNGIVQSHLYFSADDGVHAEELWKTDGTPEGTILLKDINPGATTSFPSPVTALESAGIFTADDGVHGCEIWRTDGTEAGTYMVKDIRPGAESSYPGNFALLGSILYFSAADGVHGRELWKTDGTAEGPVLAVDYESGGASGITAILSWNGALYFGDNSNIWKSNGTPAGTLVLKYGAGYVYAFTPVASCFYFIADDGIHGIEIWRSDGTSAGTYVVKNIAPSGSSISYRDMTVAGNLLFFTVYDQVGGQQLWRSDGTAQGTYVILSTPSGDVYAWFSDFKVMDGILYFGAQGMGDFGSIWRSDGTIQGTYKTVQVNEGISSISYFDWYLYLGPPQGNALLFTAEDGVHGHELWRSDGTELGTSLLADFIPGPEGSWPWPVQTSIGMFLTASDFEYTSQCEGFWKTDGTEAGTVHVTGFNAGDFREFGGRVVMGADEGVHGYELWQTDGTTGGSLMIKDIYPGPQSSNPSFIGALNGFLLFTAADGLHGRELWRTDGTPEGTLLVKDIFPGPESSGVLYTWLISVMGGAISFFADDGTHGGELWMTDGTESGTKMVKDITPGPEGTYFHDVICSAANRVFFFVSEDIWVSDGTESGTFKLMAFQPGPAGVGAYWMAPWESFMFFLANDGIHGRELWVSDGTVAGTRMVKDIFPGAGSSFPQFLLAAPKGLYFAAFEPQTGYELWRTDGTEAGTLLVIDLWPGPGSSMPFEALRLDDGRLIFSAQTPQDGFEVWETDGTAAHTLKITDIDPGPGSSLPRYFTQAGSSVFFQATDDVHGFELWEIPVDSSGSVPDGGGFQGEPLRVEKSDAGTLGLSWGASCYYRDGDYAVYSGPLGSWAEAGPLTCTTGGERIYETPLPSADQFYLVVPRTSNVEGSYGRDSLGNERPPSSSACAPQAVRTCL